MNLKCVVRSPERSFFGKFIGTLGVIGGHLYEVWVVYGDPLGVIRGRLYEVWEVYGYPMGVIGGRLYEVH